MTDEVFNVGSGTETSLLELCRMLCDGRATPTWSPVRARAQGQPGHAAPRLDRARATEARLRGTTGLREGLALMLWHASNCRVGAANDDPDHATSVGTAEAEAAAEAIRSGWISQGKRTEEFERLVAEYVGARHGIATNNCTTALHLALVAAGVGPGDEVICPSFSFIATANAILHAGATPVFVDIDPRTYNIDPGLVEDAITPRTKAILPVDQIGLAADIPAFSRSLAGIG